MNYDIFWRVLLRVFASLLFLLGSVSASAAAESVGLYRVFEKEVLNGKSYANKFTDVELLVDYIAPSGKKWSFWGFYDGDGEGGGDLLNGDVWKLRFMPNETGVWSYAYRWSDGAEGGAGTFEVTEENAGKGVIKPYKDNPHWFAYNGDEPVWLKSYYETGHGSIAQDFDWVTDNVFQPLVDHGYNHIQVNWLMSLCCYGQYYKDGPAPSTLDLDLYEPGKASSTMKLNVWKLMERRMAWLNERDVGVHMFLGMDGSKNDGPRWEDLSDDEKVFYVKYSVARLGPFANLSGWNFTWEVDGGRETHELGLAKLIAQYDIFGHLSTYQDEHPRENHFTEDAYNFAGVENHRIISDNKTLERYNYWRTPWTHYISSLISYVGKPVYMVEGNALWRRYWHPRSGANQDDLRRSAWAVAMAGASFNWNGHSSEYELTAHGPDGLPFSEVNEFHQSEAAVELVARVMNEELEFYKMTPQSEQLTAYDPFRVFALAETGRQYAVFSIKGEPFSLFLEKGRYTDNVWVDAKTGGRRKAPAVTGLGAIEVTERGGENREEWPQAISFKPPSTDTDWVLLVRKEGVRP